MIEIKSRYARELLQWIIVNCAVFPLRIHCNVLAKKLGWKTYGPKMPGGATSCPAVGEAIRALVKYGYITFTQPKRGVYLISITQTLQTIIDAAKGNDREVLEAAKEIEKTTRQTAEESVQLLTEVDNLSRKVTELNATVQELLVKEQTEIIADLIEKVERHDHILGIAEIVTITTKQLDALMEGKHASDGS